MLQIRAPVCESLSLSDYIIRTIQELDLEGKPSRHHGNASVGIRRLGMKPMELM